MPFVQILNTVIDSLLFMWIKLFNIQSPQHDFVTSFILHHHILSWSCVAITVYKGEVPPLLLFFQAIMNSVQDERQLPREDLSVESVRCALQHNFVELVTHWVTQRR